MKRVLAVASFFWAVLAARVAVADSTNVVAPEESSSKVRA